MKRAVLYLVVAVVLGLALTLIPLFALKTETNYGYAVPTFERSINESLKDAWGLRGPSLSVDDFRIFVFGLIVASIVYIVFRRRMLH